ncbi:MAG: AsmA family protein [Phycisphaerales bacterium]|nr:AsmA family protein [Phycisphaerales bacterium]
MLKWVRRWWLWVPTLVVLLVAAIPLVLWKNPDYLRAMVEQRLSDEIGGEVQIGRLTWSGRWLLDVEELTIRVPDMEGPAGEVLSVDRMSLQLGPFDRGWVRDVTIHEATINLVESRSETWSLTLNQLHPDIEPASGTGGVTRSSSAPVQLPSITIQSLNVINARMERGALSTMGSGTFAGSLVQATESGDLVFDLRETGDGSAALVGQWQTDTGDLQIDITGLAVGPRMSELIPFRVVRAYMRQLDIEADIDLVTLQVRQGESPSVSMWLDRASMLLDPTLLGIGKDTFWERYPSGGVVDGVPRLIATDGWMQFQDDQFQVMGLEGVLAGAEGEQDVISVPYRVSLTISELPRLGDLDQLADLQSAIADRPFSFDVTGWDIRLSPQTHADLPADVARILHLFEVRQCTVQTGIALQRDQIGGPVKMSGWLEIEDGLGAYARFPYDLRDLEADIRLEDEDIKVRSLFARGSGDSTVSITGRVESSMGRELQVQINARDVPLDADMLQAMQLRPRAQATLKDIFSEQNIESSWDPQLGQQIVDLNLLITQDQQENLTIKGEIPFSQLEITWSEFPLLLHLGQGRIRWDDRLYLEGSDGMPVSARTDSRGVGTLAGAIEIPDGDGPAGGRIDFDLKDEEIGPALLSALDTVSNGALIALAEGHCTGELSTTGHVAISGPDTTYNLNATIRGGQLQPTPSLDELVGIEIAGATGGEHVLAFDCDLEASTSSLDFHHLSLRSGNLEASVTGRVRAVDGPVDMHVSASGVQVAPWILSELHGKVKAHAEALWARWHPTGLFSGAISIQGQPPMVKEATIRDCDLMLNESQRLRIEGGHLLMTRTSNVFQALQLSAESPGGLSTVLLQGDIHSGDVRGRLEFDASPLQLDLGLMESVLEFTAGPEAAQWWEELDLAGEVTAQGRWQQGVQPDWSILVEPHAVEATWRSQRVSFVDDGSSQVAIGPSGMMCTPIQGSIDGTGQLQANGQISLDPGGVDLRLSYQGGLRDSLPLAAGGNGWQRVLDATELEDSRRTRIEDARIQLEEDQGIWTGDVQGRVLLQEATLQAGVTFESISAVLDVDLNINPEAALVDIDISGASATAKKIALSGLHGRIVSDPYPAAPDMIRIEDLKGYAGGGHVLANAVVGGVEDAWTAEILLADARLTQLFPKTTDASDETITGVVDASLYLTGGGDDSPAPVGVGGFRVTHGHLARLPMLIAVQQLLHLSSPVVGALAFVDVDFSIRGHEAMLSEIVLASGPEGGGGFRLQGDGVLDVDSMMIDARLRPRGNWPIVSDVIGLFQDHLYEFAVTGAIGSPETELVPLPGLSSRRAGADSR